MPDTEKPKRTRKKATPKPTVTDPVQPVEVVEPPPVQPVESTKPKVEPFELIDELTPFDLASEVLERRLGIGSFIASRLANKLTEDEQKELAKAHETGDHETYNRLVSVLRFRKTPKQ